MLTETEFERLRANVPELENAFEAAIGDRIDVYNLWKVAVVVGRMIGETMKRDGKDGADAITGIGVFCDIVLAEGGYTLTIARVPTLQ
jgi:hypothetical protein